VKKSSSQKINFLFRFLEQAKIFLRGNNKFEKKTFQMVNQKLHQKSKLKPEKAGVRTKFFTENTHTTWNKYHCIHIQYTQKYVQIFSITDTNKSLSNKVAKVYKKLPRNIKEIKSYNTFVRVSDLLSAIPM